MVKFGTGGWRAIIGDEFTKANIQLLAQGLVNKMISEGVTDRGIVMGYDIDSFPKRPCSGQQRCLPRQRLKHTSSTNHHPRP